MGGANGARFSLASYAFAELGGKASPGAGFVGG
jgi:hypothetical protein